MKQILTILLILLVSQQVNAQHVYQIRADSVRIYNVCDTAELIIENRTRGVAGFLFNKGNGRTEFRRLKLESIGGNQIAISGQDTLDISTLPGIGGVDSIYRDGDYVKYVKRGNTHSLYAPVSQNETLQSVTDRGNTTTNNIQANTFKIQQNGPQLSNGTSGVLRITTANGYTDVGSQNAGWSHFETDRPSFFFNRDVHIQGAFRRYGTTGYFDGYKLALQAGDGNGVRFWDDGDGYAIWMSQADHGTFGGRVANNGVNDYNMYFKMTAGNRGFVFIPGNNQPVVQIDNEGIYNKKWFRTVGDGGWFSETFGGGWHMLDNSWIRSYGGKSIYHDIGYLRTDGTLQVGSAGSTFSVPNGGTPTIYGNTVWHAGNDGSGSGLDADLLDGQHASDILGNWGQLSNHAGTTDFNGINRFGSTYINGGANPPANGPGNGSLLQYYSWAYSLGSEYGVGSYNLQMAMGRSVVGNTETGPYLYRRFNENGSYTPWTKIAAGHADNAGTLNGIESGRVVYGENGTATINLNASDLNEVYKSGFYNGSGMTNAPSADWYNVVHTEHSGGGSAYSNQIAQKFTGNTNEVNVFLRTQYNNSWGPWREIWHTGNLAFSITGDAYKLAQRDGSGQLLATGFYQSSHSSLKENIQSFQEPALPLINSLIIKSFHYKNDKEHNQHFGILADSSDWHFSTRKQDRFDTNSSLAIAIKAIQELSKDKEQLLKQLSVLEERLSKLEKLMEVTMEK